MYPPFAFMHGTPRTPTKEEVKAETSRLRTFAQALEVYYEDIPDDADADLKADWDRWKAYTQEVGHAMDTIESMLGVAVKAHPDIEIGYIRIKAIAKEAYNDYREVCDQVQELKEKEGKLERKIYAYRYPSKDSQIKEVSCPYCDADKGEYCVTKFGNQADSPHNDRAAKYTRLNEDNIAEVRQKLGEIRDELHPLQDRKETLNNARICLRDTKIRDQGFVNEGRLVVMAPKYGQTFNLVRSGKCGTSVWEGTTEFTKEALRRLIDAGIQVDILDGHALHLMTEDK